MRILIVSQYFRPDITAAAFRIAETADGLAARGHQVTVICARPHRGHASAEPAESGGCAVHRTPILPLRGGGGLLGHLLHYLSFVAGAAAMTLRLAPRGRFDIVWVTSPPLFVGLAGWFAARLHRAPMVLDIRDIWPASAVAAGQIGASGRAFAWGKRLEAWLYARAAAITCVARPMAAILREASGRPVTTIYNGVRAAAPGIDSAPGAGAGPVPERCMLYAGNLGRVQRLDLLIEAFGEIAAEPDFRDWRLDLVGAGVLAADLRHQAGAGPAADRIAFTGALAKRETAARLVAADLLVLNLEDHPALGATIPSKVFDYMAAGRPIVAGLGGEGAEILAESGGNCVHPPSDGSAMRAALRRAMRDVEALGAKAAANRALVAERYSREAAVEALVGVFEAVLAARSPAPRANVEAGNGEKLQTMGRRRWTA